MEATLYVSVFSLISLALAYVFGIFPFNSTVETVAETKANPIAVFYTVGFTKRSEIEILCGSILHRDHFFYFFSGAGVLSAVYRDEDVQFIEAK